MDSQMPFEKGSHFDRMFSIKYDYKMDNMLTV